VLLESKNAVICRTTFLTSTTAARHMIGQGSGVILAFGGDGDPPPGYYLGGPQVAFSAMEALRRNLASELGPHGIPRRNAAQDRIRSLSGSNRGVESATSTVTG
jgi:enoyl-[acyl-carrier-protein] reductase (NADH)